MGAITAAGLNVAENYDALCHNRTGIGPLQILQTSHKVPAGEIKLTNNELASHLGLSASDLYSRTTLLGLTAAKEALKDSGINPKETRTGFLSATSVGGMDLTEKHFTQLREGKGKARVLLEHDCGASTEHIARAIGISDYVTTISTACSSSANAIITADRLLRHHLLDAVVVGGVDPLCKFTVNGFASLYILDSNLCRPFDDSRSGLNLGEGAGYIVLQREEDLRKKAYGKILGYANANDAYHQTATSANGEGPYLAMNKALKKAGLRPEQIDYINVHGTGTGNNDLSEGTALKRVFGEEVPPFSSTKVFTGHTLGACGGIEAVYSLLSIGHNTLFATYNFQTPIKELGLSPITQKKEQAGICTVMSNSFGFGGNVSTLIFGK